MGCDSWKGAHAYATRGTTCLLFSVSICQESEPEISHQNQWFPISDYEDFSPLQRTGKVLSVCCFKINITNMFFRKESLSSRNTEIFLDDRASQTCFKLMAELGE